MGEQANTQQYGDAGVRFMYSGPIDTSEKRLECDEKTDTRR